ncbi:MAG: hypothetical protein ACLFM1_11820, partial [Bacteroidales bacterium]
VLKFHNFNFIIHHSTFTKKSKAPKERKAHTIGLSQPTEKQVQATHSPKGAKSPKHRAKPDASNANQHQALKGRKKTCIQ